MSRRLKIFIKIAYYVLTFGLGILLAVILPGALLYETLVEDMNYSLLSGDYEKSMSYIGGYYDSELSYSSEFEDGSKIIIYKAMTVDIDKTPNKASLSYSGFLYNIKDKYKDKYLEYGNRTCLMVNDGLDDEKKISLLNYDSNNDGVFDSINTLVNYSYVYFEIKLGSVEEIKSLTFYDCEFNKFKEINLSLKFDDLFFTSLDSFVTEFNQNNSSSELITLENAFLSQKDSYKKGSYGDVYGKVNMRAATVVVIYFIAIYIIADFLVGQHFIIRFIGWIINKFRKKGKNKESQIIEPEIGADYYSQVTFKVEVEDTVSSNISITYTNEKDEINVLLTKASNYEVTKRVHAGTYTNFRFESSELEAVDAPKNLEVRGFKVNILIHTKKKGNNEVKAD